jgi:hypothetical protein
VNRWRDGHYHRDGENRACGHLEWSP